MKQNTSERCFWTYWTALTVSAVGDGVSVVALPIIAVKSLHATAFGTSLIVASSYAAWLLVGLPAGVWVSRYELQRLQVALDVCRAMVLVTVPLAGLLGVLSLAQIVLVALIVGLASVLHEVSSSVFLPSIVPSETLADRNGWLSGGYAVAQVSGPSLGGLLVQVVGATACVLVDVFSYVFSALCLSRLPRLGRLEEPTRERLSEALLEGVAFVRKSPGLVSSCRILVSLNLACGGVQALAPVFLLRTLHQPSVAVGILLGTEGAGAALGAMLSVWLSRRLSLRLSSAVFSLTSAVGIFCISMTHPGRLIILFALGNILLGIGLAGVSTVLRTYRQMTTPAALLPRVMATVRFASWGALPIGALMAGGLTLWLGISSTLMFLSIVGSAAAAFATVGGFDIGDPVIPDTRVQDQRRRHEEALAARDDSSG